jgi:dihydropteroate synthase
VVRELAKRVAVPISVDTTLAEVARQCLDAGAAIINDVSGLRGDPAMPALAAGTGAGVIVMHMQGTPATMQVAPKYGDVVAEVGRFFEERLASLTAVGVNRDAIALDPGIGFGKTTEHNLRLLANLDRFRRFDRPLCLGVSRKGFAGRLCNRPDPEDRMPASLAVACFAVAANAAHVLRVHDVAPTRDAAVLWDAISQHREQP